MEDADVLTARELEILSLTGSGHSAQEIADLLRLSRCAVENHRRRIYRKLGVAGQGQAVFRGLGLLEPDGAPAVERAGGRELVVVHARCPIAGEVVTRAVIGAGRALAAVRGPLPYDEEMQANRLTAVLVDPVADDWALPGRLGARAIAVPSAPPGPCTVTDAVARGAYAVLWLGDVPGHLCAVLDLVAAEYLVVGAGMVQRFGPAPRLTEREAEVLASIARGDTIKLTARLLGIAGKTVESTRARLFVKLGARNRSEALTNAYRAGLLPPGPPSGRPRRRFTGRGSSDRPGRK
ncbi:LuxR C-terminal-related transcriptional regulator [Nonomuraea sp. PA05]|uniref:LuxR C-terminal-related transcriptional regulator n=1 Tax=Nonomuraea sp. PA05 TaxID=2604466 RepID=UPI0021CC6BE4|nr:LuxR C-terminal-related transcriptional regulator [Nonomuraea sp. PA05]